MSPARNPKPPVRLFDLETIFVVVLILGAALYIGYLNVRLRQSEKEYYQLLTQMNTLQRQYLNLSGRTNNSVSVSNMSTATLFTLPEMSSGAVSLYRPQMIQGEWKGISWAIETVPGDVVTLDDMSNPNMLIAKVATWNKANSEVIEVEYILATLD